MRTKLNCLFAAVAVAGCGGANEAAAPPPPQDDRSKINPVVCDTPAPVATVNGAASNGSTPRLQGGKTFTVSVQVQNAAGLSFEWRSTDGKVEDVNAATTTWRAPEGPGLHFVYVLVKNNKGGYTQRRVAMSTEDAAGVPAVTFTPQDYAPPPAPEANCFQFRSYVRTQEFYGRGTSSGSIRQGNADVFLGGDAIYLPDVELFATEAVPLDPLRPLPAVRVGKTDLRGSFVIDHAPPGQIEKPNVGNQLIEARLPGNLGDVSPVGVDIDIGLNEAKNDVFGQPLSVAQPITGRVVLADGQTACGIVDEFFGKEVSGTATLLDAAGKAIATRRLSDKGHYAFPQGTGATKVRLQCENSKAVDIAVSTTAPRTILTDSSPPVVTGMTATLQGSTANVGIFLTPFSGGQSDKLPDSTTFLAYKGVDNALSTCMYYRSIGAVKQCGKNGELIGAITFDDWQRKVGLGPFERDGKKAAKAKFINAVDLNLSRDHAGISYKPGEAGMIVSNYLGAGGGAKELESSITKNPELARAEIDAAIDGMVSEKNLVARVVMDHTSTPGVNGGLPFTNFMIFGASGELLPRINLDGRSEKWVPGTCVPCHGNDRYTGRFPTDGTGSPDIGTHLLPFIPTNYNYSSKVGLRRVDQEKAMFDLNQIVAQANTSQGIKEAVAGWYGNGQVFNDNFLPASWANKSAADKAFYQQVYFADCLGCHVAAPPKLNFDHYENLVQGNKNTITALNIVMCGGGDITNSSAYVRNMSMPAALRTFDLTQGTAGRKDIVDKMAVTANFIRQYLPDVTKCSLNRSPLP